MGATTFVAVLESSSSPPDGMEEVLSGLKHCVKWQSRIPGNCRGVA